MAGDNEEPKPKRRGTALSPAEMYVLNAACIALEPAFGANLYLVGSVLERRDFRDVDVRAILPDEEFERWFPGLQGEGHDDPRWALVNTAISRMLQQQTGLRIDFQIQQQTRANERHEGMRSALGMRIGAFADPPAAASEDTPA